jgi:acetyl esterase
MVCFLPDYRVYERHKTLPFESLKDAKSAIRYIRMHADEFSIYPDKIVGSGGSAGGHLAAAAALTDSINDERDDLSISCKPNALVLFNPVIDNGPGGFGYDNEFIRQNYKNFSPLHNIRKGAPPTITFLVLRTNIFLLKQLRDINHRWKKLAAGAIFCYTKSNRMDSLISRILNIIRKQFLRPTGS